jgi:tripartite-type tricarboxylate transporter receptor subunit TctC
VRPFALTSRTKLGNDRELRSMRNLRRRALLTAATLALPAIARAQSGTDWPTRPVRVIAPYAAGGGSDLIGRPLMDKLSRLLGQQFVFENRGGAAGALGTEAVAKATPDGYTLLLTPQGPIQILPHLRAMAYDPLRDLIPVGRLTEQVTGMGVHPSTGGKDLASFIAALKRDPGKYSYATAGVGSVNHLRGETFKMMAGVELLHIPYRGTGEALPDLLSGIVHLVFDSTIFPHVKGGKLLMPAILGAERLAEFPDVKTMAEQGMPDYDVPGWYGMYAPAGVAPAILEKLRQAIGTIATDQEFRDKQMAVGMFVYREVLSLPALRDRVAMQSKTFADLIKKANIKLES